MAGRPTQRRQPRTAGAGVHQTGMATVTVAHRPARRFDVFARTGAGVGQALRGQVLQRLLVGVGTSRLKQRRLVGHQPDRSQLTQDQGGHGGHAARRVHVFNAHQPLAAVGACIQPAGQCGNQ